MEEEERTSGRNEEAWARWAALGTRVAMAPMVDGSDLAFRAQVRAQMRAGERVLCYAPMVSARALCQLHASLQRRPARAREAPAALAPLFFRDAADRPLVVQLSGNEPALVARAAAAVAPWCEGVDLNLGCPQHIAARARIGAFLMAEPALVERVVRAMARALRGGPLVCVKMRVLPRPADTVAFAQMLERAGCQLLTVHGRTKEQRGPLTGDADWSQIRNVVRAVGIPVIANGNIARFEDIERCMAETGAAGVMSAWSLLRDPAFFAGPRKPFASLEEEVLDEARRAEEWLDWAAQYRDRGNTVSRNKLHVFKRLYAALLARPLLRQHLSLAASDEDIRAVIRLVRDPSLPLPELPPRPEKPAPPQEEEEELDEDTNEACWNLFES